MANNAKRATKFAEHGRGIRLVRRAVARRFATASFDDMAPVRKKDVMLQTDIPVPNLSLCFCNALRMASKHLMRLYGDALAPSGLRISEFAALSVIGAGEDVSLHDLGARFLLDRSSLRYRLKPMLEAGLIDIVADPRDRRGRRVRLTAKGETRLAAAKPLWLEAQARFEETLGKAHAESLRSTVRTVGSASFAEAFRAL